MTEFLLRHMEDLLEQVDRTGIAASRFLTPAEAVQVEEGMKHRPVTLIFDGGFPDAERRRAIFLTQGKEAYDRAEWFAAIQIQSRAREVLRHQDILGAIMALGIERDTIGDIAVEGSGAALVCLPELGDYIVEHLVTAGRAGLSLGRIRIEELPDQREAYRIKADTVASLRLDAILSAAFGLSRAKAAALISAAQVNLDYQLCLQPAKELKEGALLSVRGLGRAKLLETGGLSKKNRIFVKIGLYSRSGR